MERMILGTGWRIFLSGRIDPDAAVKFEAFLKEKDVPVWSYVVLNSPGGSVYGAMELGRVFRKFQLNTDVGIRISSKGDDFSFSAGECYSACAYAYLGGQFRFLNKGSRFGVHRFYATNPAYGDMDTAQITSAHILAYLREMGIDPEFFNLSTKAGGDEIFEPPLPVLEKLSIVNNGTGPTTWSIESPRGIMYLKGERNTERGINKFVVGCADEGVFLYIIFDPQGHQQEAMNMHAHSLVIDLKDEPINLTDASIQNGWFNGVYSLTTSQVRRIMSAKTVGVILRGSYEAPIFLGFNDMPFSEGAADKLVGIVRPCAR